MLDNERPDGVLVQFGGQTPLKLARALEAAGYPIWGTSPESIDLAEDRGRFGQLLARARPRGAARTPRRAPRGGARGGAADRLSARGAARPTCSAAARWRSCSTTTRLARYMARGRRELPRASGPDRPLPRRRRRATTWTRSATATDDLDRRHPAAHRGGRDPLGRLLLGAARRGRSRRALLAEIRDATRRLARALAVRGLVNIQFAIQHGKLYVLEVNPRASRTVPFVSKAIGVADGAGGGAARGRASRSPSLGLPPERDPVDFFIKAPVFPFTQVPGRGRAARARR